MANISFADNADPEVMGKWKMGKLKSPYLTWKWKKNRWGIQANKDKTFAEYKLATAPTETKEKLWENKTYTRAMYAKSGSTKRYYDWVKEEGQASLDEKAILRKKATDDKATYAKNYASYMMKRFRSKTRPTSDTGNGATDATDEPGGGGVLGTLVAVAVLGTGGYFIFKGG